MRSISTFEDYTHVLSARYPKKDTYEEDIHVCNGYPCGNRRAKCVEQRYVVRIALSAMSVCCAAYQALEVGQYTRCCEE